MKNPFKESPEHKEQRLTKKAEAKDNFRKARGIDMENLPTMERFRIDVSENLTGLGGPLGGFTRSKGRNSPLTQLSYRVVVTDLESGRPLFVRPAITYKAAYQEGERWVRRRCEGKRAMPL